MGIYILMVFIWIIGWLIACGQHHYSCEVTKEKQESMQYIVLFFIWPHYLGYRSIK